MTAVLSYRKGEFMRSSFRNDDVVLLLKDITGLVEPQHAKERERLIQQGRHYSEMLPVEYVPTEPYMRIYENALVSFAKPTAEAIGVLADRIISERSEHVVLVSLARAGTPIGVLLKRYLRFKYHVDVPHYSISIIRGRGIDHNAMQYLLNRFLPKDLLFVDGWIGKGAIQNQLKQDIAAYPGVSPTLAVVADPAKIGAICGTTEDILIPSSCLNCTVTGLISRTFLREDVIKADDFHGAVYYGELAEFDLTYSFIEEIARNFDIKQQYVHTSRTVQQLTGAEEVEKIAENFGVADTNLIKPGIGETTRVLLRRVPWKILVGEQYKNDPALFPIFQLAKEKNVPVVVYPLMNYKTCGIIKKMADT